MSQPQSEIDDKELARILIANAVFAVLENCANTYVNAWTENWLAHARRLGAYQGELVGRCEDLKDELHQHDLPKLPQSPEQIKRLEKR